LFDEVTVCDGFLVPLIRRRPTGGLRNLIGDGPDGRREEDGILDGEDAFVVGNECTLKKMYMDQIQTFEFLGILQI
jgi:hypothetical protein